MWRKFAWSFAFAALGVACQGKQELVPQAAAADAGAGAMTPVAGKTVDDVLAAYATARGGKEKLSAVSSVRLTGTMAGTQMTGLPVTVEKKRPDKYHRVVDDPEGRQVSGFDGHVGWQQHGPGAPRPLPPAMTPRLRRTADIDGPLVDPRAKGIKPELLGKQQEGNGEVYAVKLTFDDGDSATYYIDTKSNLLLKSRERVPTTEGPKEAVTSYQDYRPVHGVIWPFKQLVVTPENNRTQSFTWSNIEVNPPLDDARFGLPKS